MLKTHANGLRSIIRLRESRHEDLKVEVIPGTGRKDFHVQVEGDEFLINDMMSEHASFEYLDNDEQTRHRLSRTSMEFR